MDKIDIIFLIFALIFAFSLGWLGGEVYENITLQRTINGLWINGTNYSNAVGLARTIDTYGNWICVNINGMEIEEAYNTCRHEVGHEIFAGKCEKDINKCFEVFYND